MTLITAHTGAHSTGHNSQAFIDSIGANGYEAFEVDIRCRAGRLYIAHNIPLCAKNRVGLDKVFEVVKRYNVRINCDLKENIFRRVQQFGIDMGIGDNLIYTGLFHERDLSVLTAGDVYLNHGYFVRRKLKIEPSNCAAIKKMIDDMHNPHVKGINLSYGVVTDEFLAAAKACDLRLSVYTVQDPAVYERLLRAGVDNITTMLPLDVMKRREELQNA